MRFVMNIIVSMFVYFGMWIRHDDNAMMTAMIVLNIMILRDDIVKAIKETKL